MIAIQIMLAALEAIEKLASNAPQVIAIINATRDTINTAKDEGRNPTAEEWNALNDQINAEMAKVRAPVIIEE